MSNSPITVHHAVRDLTQSTKEALHTAHRWNELAEKFQERYGSPPTHIVRAPGRVNIIGEHIDYALFGVLPAAIEKELVIAIRATPESKGLVEVDNMNSKYTKASFTALRRSESKDGGKDQEGEWDLAINPKGLRWESYVKAGYLGVLERFFSKDTKADPVGLQALFDSTVPAGSGVSSSAALIVASTLAFLVANDKLSSITKFDLVQMSVGNEKRVGVNSGGMDQSASILSAPGHALYISFYPSLQVSPVPIPSSADNPIAFLVANSLTVSNKAETGKVRYNLRVVETLVGAKILANILGVKTGEEERAAYREVLQRWRGEKDSEEALKEEITALLEGGYLEKLKGKEQLGVTLEEMVEMSGLSSDVFHKVFLSWVEVEATYFQLYKRALHVFTEARRVLEFRDLCRQSGPSLPEKLGELMDASQKSCAELFECSCPELDELVGLAKSLGAYGARLTGAGWGGCACILLKEGDVVDFMKQLRASYGPYKHLDDATFAETCFATKPAEGACVFTL